MQIQPLRRDETEKTKFESSEQRLSFRYKKVDEITEEQTYRKKEKRKGLL